MQNIETARKAAGQKTVKPKKSDSAVKKTAKKPGEPSAPAVWINTARNYLREVSYELRKVVWPSRKETVGSTAVVLVIVGLASAFLGIVDYVLSRMVRLLVG